MNMSIKIVFLPLKSVVNILYCKNIYVNAIIIFKDNFILSLKKYLSTNKQYDDIIIDDYTCTKM